MLNFTAIEMKRFHVNLRASTPFTEIYIINSKFERILSDIGEVNATLDSGTYTFRFQEGDAVRDVTLYLNEDRSILDPVIGNNSTYSVDALEFSYPSAFEFCFNIDCDGVVNPIVLDASKPIGDDDENIVNVILLDTEELDSGELPDQFRQLNLSIDMEGEIYQLPFITSLNWQTYAKFDSIGGIESLAVSVIDSENDHNQYENLFSEDHYFLKMSRVAMKSLVNKRNVVSKNALKFLTNRKWFLPWHGILALHLQTQKPEPNFNLIRIMVSNLERIYEGQYHPDILAIKWWMWVQRQTYTEPEPVLLPPALSNSWKLLLQAHAISSGEIFSVNFSNEYEPRMRMKGPWLFNQSTDLNMRNKETLKEIVKSTIAEYMMDIEPLRHLVHYVNEEEQIKLSSSLLKLIDGMKGRLTVNGMKDKLPINLLVLALFDSIVDDEIEDQISNSSKLHLIESSGMREKLVLSTAHSIYYLLRLFVLETESEQSLSNVENNSQYSHAKKNSM